MFLCQLQSHAFLVSLFLDMLYAFMRFHMMPAFTFSKRPAPTRLFSRFNADFACLSSAYGQACQLEMFEEF